jgi:hypothetical protein
MEGKEVECKDRIEEDESEIEEDVGERRFKVGDLVEFREVALVRGYRTASLSRVLIDTPSCLFMRTKCTYTEITS